MSREKKTLDAETLFAYAENELSAADREQVEAILREDPEAARRVAEHRKIMGLLAEPHPDVAGIDLAPAIQARIGEDRVLAAHREAEATRVRAEESRARGRQRMLLSTAVAAAAAICLAVLVRPKSDIDAKGFREKAAGGTGSEKDQWAGIQVRRVAAGGTFETDPREIRRNDRLVFSYTNVGSQPFEHLMIVGVDASGQVRWFHPEYEQEGSDPTSVPIEAGGTKLLPDQVAHDYAPGPLTIHALFTRQPLRVSQVERWLSEHTKSLEELAGTGVSLQSSQVNVAR